MRKNLVKKKIKKPLFLQTLEIPKKLLQIYGKGQEDPGLKDQTQKDPDPKDHGPKDPQN